MLPRSMLAVLSAACATPLVCGQDTALTWRGEPIALDALATAAPHAVDTVRAWLPFAARCGYRLVMSDDGRFVLGLSATFERRKPNREIGEVEALLALLRSTAAVTDRFLPAPAADAPPAVIVGARTEHYAELLAHVASLDARLAAWAAGAGRAVAGYVLSEPRIAAWIEDPSGVDEWHPHNELVHRAAQLAIRGHARNLPDWLLLGLAWHVEDTVRESIWCFPFRSGFVSVDSHADWGLWLANEFKKSRRRKADKPAVLGIDEFAAWRSDEAEARFDAGTAYVSFGVARFLAEQHTEHLAGLLKALDARIEEGRKVWVSAHEWTTDPKWRVPAAEQLAMLAGDDAGFLADVTAFFVAKKANQRRRADGRR